MSTSWHWYEKHDGESRSFVAWLTYDPRGMDDLFVRLASPRHPSNYLSISEKSSRGWSYEDAKRKATAMGRQLLAREAAMPARGRADPSRMGTPTYRGRQKAQVSVTVEWPDGRVEFKTWSGASKASIMKAARERYEGARLSFGNVVYVARDPKRAKRRSRGRR